MQNNKLYLQFVVYSEQNLLIGLDEVESQAEGFREEAELFTDYCL